jgi:hypothetical protein
VVGRLHPLERSAFLLTIRRIVAHGTGSFLVKPHGVRGVMVRVLRPAPG